MMKWSLILMLATVSAQDISDTPKIIAIQMDEEVEDCQRGIKDLKNDMIGLEFFLQDKKDYEKYCPTITWIQPTIQIYKTDPKSYLPENCKPTEEGQ